MKRNFALARIERNKKEISQIYNLSSTNDDSVNKNFTNFATTRHVVNCEWLRKNSQPIFVKGYKKFSHSIYFIYIYRERERERDELVKWFANKFKLVRQKTNV